ncbi:MAG: hypothetical protein AAFY28_08430, partial [Actinomycetota bacterium]
MNEQSDQRSPRTPTSTERRVHDHLREVAERATVPPSSPATARRRARARTIRRRRAVAGGLAAASVLGVVLGVRALSEPRPTSIRTVDKPAVDTDDQTPTDTGSVNDVEGAGASDVTAVVAEPAFVWKVVEPDKDRALTGTFSYGAASSFPGFELSTAPGRSNDYDNIEPVVWATDDGIEWEQTDLASPFGQVFWEPMMVGGDLFAVGTAPGVAATEANPLQVATHSGDGTDWSTVDLPIDANRYRDVPMANAGLRVERVAVGDALLVATTPQIYLDYGAIAGHLGIDIELLRIQQETDTGIVVADVDCVAASDESVVPATISLPAVGAPARPTAGGFPAGPDGCSTTEYTWDELGVPSETKAALDARVTRMFLVGPDLIAREVESPLPGASLSMIDQVAPRFMSEDAYTEAVVGTAPPALDSFEYDGTAWVARQMPLQAWATLPTPLANGLVGFSHGADGADAIRYTTVRSDGTTTYTDMTPLLGQDTIVGTGATRAVVAGGHVVSALEEFPDLIARAGGVELTVNGVTARKDVAEGPAYFVDESTGEQIPDDRIVHTALVDPERNVAAGSEEAIEVTVVDDAGETLAEFTARQLFEELTSAAYQDTGPISPQTSLLTTADGVSFSVESVADLIGVDESAVERVQRIATDGSTVVVAVAMTERHPDDSRVQLVLVGTP